MDEQDERRVLEEALAETFRPSTRRRTEKLASATRRMRVVAGERTGRCSAANVHRVLELVAEFGSGLQTTGQEIAVLVPSGLLGVNSAVLSARRRAAPDDPAAVDLHIRAAALEGKLSLRTAAKLLNKVAKRVDPHLTTPLRAAP
jgi:hypothetical protein